MAYPTRIYYTVADKALMWDRWQKSESLHAISVHFGRSRNSIQTILAESKRVLDLLEEGLLELDRQSAGNVKAH